MTRRPGFGRTRGVLLSADRTQPRPSVPDTQRTLRPCRAAAESDDDPTQQPNLGDCARVQALCGVRCGSAGWSWLRRCSAAQPTHRYVGGGVRGSDGLATRSRRGSTRPQQGNHTGTSRPRANPHRSSVSTSVQSQCQLKVVHNRLPLPGWLGGGMLGAALTFGPQLVADASDAGLFTNASSGANYGRSSDYHPCRDCCWSGWTSALQCIWNEQSMRRCCGRLHRLPL